MLYGAVTAFGIWATMVTPPAPTQEIICCADMHAVELQAEQFFEQSRGQLIIDIKRTSQTVFAVPPRQQDAHLPQAGEKTEPVY